MFELFDDAGMDLEWSQKLSARWVFQTRRESCTDFVCKVISGGDFSAKSDSRGHVNLVSCNHCLQAKLSVGAIEQSFPVMIPWNKISCELW